MRHTDPFWLTAWAASYPDSDNKRLRTRYEVLFAPLLVSCLVESVVITAKEKITINNQFRECVSWLLTLVAAISFANVLSLCRNGIIFIVSRLYSSLQYHAQ